MCFKTLKAVCLFKRKQIVIFKSIGILKVTPYDTTLKHYFIYRYYKGKVLPAVISTLLMKALSDE